VANSPHTVLGDCISAGRLYDKIGDSATAKVVYVLDNAVVCKVKIAEKEKMCGQCSE
jgi:HIRAN domain